MNKLNKGKIKMKKYLTCYSPNQTNLNISSNGDFWFKVNHYDLNNNFTHYTWKQIPSIVKDIATW